MADTTTQADGSQEETATTSTDQTPPWGTDEEFNPERAWALIQNLRGEIAQHKQAAATARQQAESLTSQVQSLVAERDKALADSQAATESLTVEKTARVKERLLAAAGLDAERFASMLTGSDESAWADQVQALAALRGEKVPKPDPAQSATTPAVDDRAALAHQVFGD